MILATHLVFSCYGFWPPNDDRGSWSDTVWAPHLREFGDAKKVDVGHSIAHTSHDRAKNRAIQDALLYPVVRLNEQQRMIVGEGIEEVVRLLKITIHACAVMPDHVHLIVAPHQERVETLSGYFKRAATKGLTQNRMHPLNGYVNSRGNTPTPWVHGEWKRFIDAPRSVFSRIRYVQNNPVQIGLPPQHYAFVRPFGGESV